MSSQPTGDFPQMSSMQYAATTNTLHDLAAGIPMATNVYGSSTANSPFQGVGIGGNQQFGGIPGNPLGAGIGNPLANPQLHHQLQQALMEQAAYEKDRSATRRMQMPLKHTMLPPKAPPRPQPQPQPKHLQQKVKPMSESERRLVQVFIADPDPSVPLDKCLIYSGEQKLTELDDQELFLELDFKGLLDKHNAMRTQIIDKSLSAKDNPVYLEPARAKNLQMTVVTVAQF